MSPAPSSRAPTSCHAADARAIPPPNTGTRPNATVPSAMLQKPAARSRSSVRPSTRKRTLVSTQTKGHDDDDACRTRASRRAARTRSFNESLAANSAVPAASRQTSSDLAEEPGPVRLGASVIHALPCRHAASADKRADRARPHRGRPSPDPRRPRRAPRTAGIRRRGRGRRRRRAPSRRQQKLKPDLIFST